MSYHLNTRRGYSFPAVSSAMQKAVLSFHNGVFGSLVGVCAVAQREDWATAADRRGGAHEVLPNCRLALRGAAGRLFGPVTWFGLPLVIILLDAVY